MSIKTNKQYKNELKEIISNSDLNKNQKELWFNFFDKVGINGMYPILDVLKEDVGQLEFLTKNLEDKVKNIQNRESL